MLRLLHISDLHFGPKYLPEVGDALLRMAQTLPSDVILITGDFTQRAKLAQYREAHAFIESLPERPTITIPGNHDVPLYRVLERIFHPYAHFQRYISPELDTVYRCDEAVIVALNTTRPLRAITNGRIDRWQLDFCAEKFANLPPDAVRIVAAHHHFAPAPDYENEDDVMPGAKRALDRFAAMGVELILGGHLHRAYIGNSLDVYPGKEREWGIVIVQAGTATSRRGRAREREKNSFNLIEIDDHSIRVIQYMYFHDARTFQPIAEHVFARRHRRYLPSANGSGTGP